MFTFRPVLGVYSATRQLLFLPEHNAGAVSGREEDLLDAWALPSPRCPQELSLILKHTKQVSRFSLSPIFSFQTSHSELLLVSLSSLSRLTSVAPNQYSSGFSIFPLPLFLPASHSHCVFTIFLAEGFHSPSNLDGKFSVLDGADKLPPSPRIAGGWMIRVVNHTFNGFSEWRFSIQI